MAPEPPNYSSRHHCHCQPNKTTYLDDDDNNSHEYDKDDFSITMNSSGDDDSFSMDGVDNISILSLDNEDDDMESLAAAAAASSSYAMSPSAELPPPERTMPILPKPNDVCFKSCKHHGTIKWRDTVKLFSDQRQTYPEWNDEVSKLIRDQLAKDNIRRFLINLGSDNKPSKKISKGMWYLATDQEITQRTKQRFLDDRKDRNQKPNGTIKRPVGRPKKARSVSASPQVGPSNLNRSPNHNQAHRETYQQQQQEPLTSYDTVYQFQWSLSELTEHPAETNQVLQCQTNDVLWKIKSDLERLHSMVSDQLQYRYQAPRAAPAPTTYQAAFCAVAMPYAMGGSSPPGPASTGFSAPRPEANWTRSNPFDDCVRNVGGGYSDVMVRHTESEGVRRHAHQPASPRQNVDHDLDDVQMRGLRRYSVSARTPTSFQAPTKQYYEMQVPSSSFVPQPRNQQHESRQQHMAQSHSEHSTSVEIEAYEFRVERRLVRSAISTQVQRQNLHGVEPKPNNGTRFLVDTKLPYRAASTPDRAASTDIMPAGKQPIATVQQQLDGSTPNVSNDSDSTHELPTSGIVAFDVSLDNEENTGKPAVIAGQQLTGRVVTSVRNTKVARGKLSVRLLGKEDAFTDGLPMMRRSTIIFEQALDLCDFSDENSLTPGDHEIPFSITLPATLPGSTDIDFQGSAGIKISYKIRFVHAIGDSDLHAKVIPFTVQAIPRPIDQCPVVWGPKTHELRSLRILKKGPLSLAVRLNRSHIGRGESLQVAIAYRNHSSVEIKQVQVKLVETIHWLSNMRCQDPYHTETMVLQKAEDTSLSEIVKRCKCSVIHSATGADGSDETDMMQELKSGVNSVSLTIPEHAHDTYAGKTVKVTHDIKVKLITSFSTENFLAKIPLTIGVPPLQPPTSTSSNDKEQPEHRRESSRHQLRTGSKSPHGEDSARSTAARPTIAVGRGTTTAATAFSGEPRNLASTAKPPPSPAAQNATANGNTSMSRVSPPNPIPTLDNLLVHMMDALAEQGDDEYKAISKKMVDEGWAEFFTSLSADDYGSIIGRVLLDSDRPRVAELLASRVGYFTCDHVAKALSKTSFRVSMTKGLMPLCADAANHYLKVKRELNDWDIDLLHSEFSDVLVL